MMVKTKFWKVVGPVLKDESKRYALYIILSIVLSLTVWKGTSITEYIWHTICIVVGFMIFDILVKWFRENIV